jgi:hypothetical protein
MFRNLLDEKHIKGALLAAILHDLGQFPLAHDLEEVCPKLFSHSSLSLELLHDETRDPKNKKTLADLINNADGWDCDMSCVETILGAHSHVTSTQTKLTGISQKDFKAEMLSALIDGPIDADKADYITRDSAECRIPYGKQLDIERLLRVMTSVRIPKEFGSKHKVTIAVYEKGRASTDAFGFSRYLLHSSIYWHHTSRIIKAMLQYGTTMLLPEAVFKSGPNPKIDEIRGTLVAFLQELVPPFEKCNEIFKQKTAKPGKKSVGKKYEIDVVGTIIKEDIQTGKTAVKIWYPGITASDWLMLEWIKRLSDNPRAQLLIEYVQGRDLYKRAFTFQRDDKNKDFIAKLEKNASHWLAKVTLCDILQKKVKEHIVNEMRKYKEPPSRSVADESEIENVFSENLAILIDIPDPKVMITSERPLIFVPELERKTYYDQTLSPVKADALSDSLELLMGSISPIRVLCHPKLRSAIQLYVKKDEMKSMIEAAIREV